MRKFKLLSLIAVVLVMAMAFSSCALFSAGFNKIYNKNYDVSADVYTDAKSISDLDGYTFTGESNDNFAVFTSGEGDNISTAIYSFRTGKVAIKLPTDVTTTYTVEFIDNAPVFRAVKTVTGDTETTVTHVYYDASGDSFISVEADKEVGVPTLVTPEIIVINSKVYDISEDGTVDEKAELPAYLSVHAFDDYTDKYFYDLGNTIVIYDDEFVPVATWTAPSYVENGISTFVLNNGNVLIQYAVLLDEDAKDFDVYNADGKYDLVSLILTPKGKVKEINLDYIVTEVIKNTELYDEDEDKEDNLYTNKFENLAVIARIENKKIDESVAGIDYVLMNNNGKAKTSLKLVDGQVYLPTMIAKDLFVVETLAGSAIVNAKGKVKFNITDDNVNIIGQYILTADAIYNFEFEKVYDLKSNEAEYLTVSGDTVLVVAGDEEKYSIIAFCNGEDEIIYKYDAEAESNKEFELVGDYGYLIIDNDAELPYSYYASNGKAIFSLESRAELVADGYDGTLLVSTVKDGVTVYYTVTK